MDGKRILTLLGLALRGGNLVLGEDMVGDALRDHRARAVLLAEDASERTRAQAERSAGTAGCLCVTIPFSREDLGRALGRAQTALAAVTDTGLAAAVMDRLAEGDPARYGEAAERMALKARRAQERRTEKKVRRREERGARPPRREGPPPEQRAGRGPGRDRRAPGTPERRPGPGPRPPRKGAPGPAGRDRPSGRERPAGPKRPSGTERPPERWRGPGPEGRRPRSGQGERPPGQRPAERSAAMSRGARTGGPRGSRPKPKAGPYAHSRPVKKGKGSFRDQEK